MESVKFPDKQPWLVELAETVLQAFDMDSLCDSMVAYICEKYPVELEDVQDAQLRNRILEERLPAALEHSGVMSAIIDELDKLGITDRLAALEKEKATLQNDVQAMRSKMDCIVDEMNALQINTFGRVIRLFDNRIIDLAEEDVDIEVIEKPTVPLRGDSALVQMNTSEQWRVLQPSELLTGFKLAVKQPVLWRKDRDTWFPGRIASCSSSTWSQSGVVTSSASTKSDMKQYRVILDAAPGEKIDVCTATTTSLALAASASDLRQKYPVGARVVSIYRDDSGGIGYYSGLIAEPPSERNSNRYLIFFDDGYTQYSPPTEIYRICHQSKENWREASEGSQDFIKRYLAQYPQRPMVRLKPNQVIETELDGDWIQATVEMVDASLALIRFSDTHSEWIYRGSTRLEPLFTDMATKQCQKVASSDRGVEVEYSNVDASLNDNTAAIKQRKARKSATGNRDMKKMASLRSHKMATVNPTSISAIGPIAVVSERRPFGHRENISERGQPTLTIDSESCGVVVPYLDHLFEDVERHQKPFIPHKCDSRCLMVRTQASSSPSIKGCENIFDYKGLNPLEIPFHVGWTRYMLVSSSEDSGRQVIVYNAPCGRQLRSMHEIQRFLDRTNSNLTTDLFSFDPTLSINSEFRAEKTLTNIVDLSYGKENVPVPCVNSVDNEVPPYIDYITHRQPVGDVPLAEDADFMVCCDCTDNCRDRSKCACQQLTAEASSLTNPSGMVDYQAGYRYRRLAQFTVGGIYECNSKCPCDRRCSNRVVQHGLWARLQVFKTSRKGWGIRALHAIPKGSFVCTYAGAIYDENMAVQEGFDFGDEYQAELDYIETVEKPKDGYESFPDDPEDEVTTEKQHPSIQACNVPLPKATSKSVSVAKVATEPQTQENSDNNQAQPIPRPHKPASQARSVSVSVPRSHSDIDLLARSQDYTGSAVSSLSRNTSNSTSSSTCCSKSSPAVSEDERRVASPGGIYDELEETSHQSEMSSVSSSAKNVFVALEPLNPACEQRVSDTDDEINKKQKTMRDDRAADFSYLSTTSELNEPSDAELITGKEIVQPMLPRHDGMTVTEAVKPEIKLDVPLTESVVNVISDTEEDPVVAVQSDNSDNQNTSFTGQTLKKEQLSLTMEEEEPAVCLSQLLRDCSSTVVISSDEDDGGGPPGENTFFPKPDVGSSVLTPSSTACGIEAKVTQKSTYHVTSGSFDPYTVSSSEQISSPVSFDSPEQPRGLPLRESSSPRPKPPNYVNPLDNSSFLDVGSNELSSSMKASEDNVRNELYALQQQSVTAKIELSPIDHPCKSLKLIDQSANTDASERNTGNIIDDSVTSPGSLRVTRRKCIEITNVDCASDGELLTVSMKPNQISEVSVFKPPSRRLCRRVDKSSSSKSLKLKSTRLSHIHRKRRRRLSLNQRKRLAILRSRNYRARQQARSSGLHSEFKHIRNVWQLLKEADFGRTPIIQLSPLPSENSGAPPSSTPVSVLPPETKHSSDDVKRRLTRKYSRHRSHLRHLCGKHRPEIKEVKVKLHKDDENEDQEQFKQEEKQNISSVEKEDTTVSSSTENTDQRRSPLTLRLRRVVSCDQLGFTTTFTRVRSRSPSPKIKTSELVRQKRPERHRPVIHRYPKRDLTKKAISNLINASRELRSTRSTVSRPSGRRSASKDCHHSHHHHHHHHHHLRDRRPKEVQQPQTQGQFRRFYPVAEKDWLAARTYFGDDNPYIMDAKRMGNLGRYFNHSCNPNVFVQNVFINSHDPRFPEVAFFTKRNIAVGEEITWDYGYTVDAVPYKVLYCYCREPNCRIRLL